MITVDVNLGERSYPIFIGTGLLGRPDLLRSRIQGSRAVVVSNEVVAPLYMEALAVGLGDLRWESVVLPDGEATKTLETVNRIYDHLLRQRHERSTTLIALGGGVTGDITGFAAATYQRGVDFVQVPTTLLAQVDSSVGGKTGVNHALGKNMIGAFHQPRCVLADTGVLETLPARELRAGLAEVIKYSLIGRALFFDWLEQHMADLLRNDHAALSQAIKICCQEKARIVALDETEGGIRALLNLGHTFGHAIEAAMGYGQWLHGEAVAAGMVMATDLSWRMGWLETDQAVRVKRLIQQAELPVAPPADMDAEKFLERMASDKKVQGGRMRLILLRGIGEAVVRDDFDQELLRQTLEAGDRLCEP